MAELEAFQILTLYKEVKAKANANEMSHFRFRLVVNYTNVPSIMYILKVTKVTRVIKTTTIIICQIQAIVCQFQVIICQIQVIIFNHIYTSSLSILSV